MSNKQAAINRANKLLRLAGPSSGTTDSERTSAALEAAKVIEENNLVVVEKIDTKKVPRQQPRPDNSVDWIKRAEATARAAEAQRAADAKRASEQDGFFTRTRSRAYRSGFTNPIPTIRDWNETIAERTYSCVVCGQLIEPGEQAWSSPIGWRHYDITCDQF